MAAFLPVESFFAHVYLVDLSPSLCNVARQRFARLGWKNVSVVCEDARHFRLPPNRIPNGILQSPDQAPIPGPIIRGADLVTMSYSLSMIPGKARCATLLRIRLRSQIITASSI